MSFTFSALYPYLLDYIELCFHLNPIFRLLPSKISTVKKKTAKNIVDNSETERNKEKEKKKEILCEFQ